MNKSELITAVAEKSGLSKKAAGEAGRSSSSTPSRRALAAGEKRYTRWVRYLRGTGEAARRGVNPATGAPIDIPATVVPAFKAGKILKKLWQSSQSFAFTDKPA